MNPIYKTGWGAYVDLGKIVAVTPTGTGCCEIYMQLCEKPLEIPSEPLGSFIIGGDEKSYTDYMERVIAFNEDQQVQIDLLISAWRDYRNRETEKSV